MVPTESYRQLVDHIAENPELEPWRETILYQSPEWDSHVAWVLNEPPAVVAAWAQDVEAAARAHAAASPEEN